MRVRSGMMALTVMGLSMGSGALAQTEHTEWTAIADLPSTTHPVTKPHPNCSGEISTTDPLLEQIFSAVGAAVGSIWDAPDIGAAVGKAIPDILHKPTQDYAVCSVACILLPVKAVVDKADGFASWHREAPDRAWIYIPDGVWGPGPFPWTYFDVDHAEKVSPDGKSKLWCKSARNWSDNNDKEYYAKWLVYWH